MTVPVPMSATDGAGDVFLSGTYLELGVSAWGNLGATQGETPAGYAQAGTHGVGIAYNAAGFGVDSSVPTIDFVTPGLPWDSFAAGYTSGGTNTSGNNYGDGGVHGIAATSLTDTSSGSRLSAEWTGVLNGALGVTVDYAFSASDQFFTTTVTLTNLTGTAMSDVRYDTDADPDNTAFDGGNYATVNTIVSQDPGVASEVTAVSSSGDAYMQTTGSPASLAYYSSSPGIVVADGVPGIGTVLNPFNPALTSGAGTTGTTGLSDTRINLAYDGGALAAGASTSFSYVTAATDDLEGVFGHVTMALAATQPSASRPALTGTAAAGDTVTVTDATGDAVLGTAIADSDGTWSLTPSLALAAGTHALTATAVDEIGTLSALSSGLTVTVAADPPPPPSSPPATPTSVPPSASPDDGASEASGGDTASTPPVVTAGFVANPMDAASNGVIYTPILAGTADPDALVTISANGTPIGTAQADATGAWNFDEAGLAATGESLVASETNSAGLTGTSAATPLVEPEDRFIVTDHTANTAGCAPGAAYSGPVASLRSEFLYSGSDNLVVIAKNADAFVATGSGDDAMQAVGGDSVLAGGTGSNWLVGGSGSDGGHDTFFVDGRDGKMTWDTILNFHPGDMLTIWGYSAGSGHMAWAPTGGASGYQGATLQTSLGAGAPSAFVTFAGLSTGSAHFDSSTGTAGGIDYLAITRTG